MSGSAPGDEGRAPGLPDADDRAMPTFVTFMGRTRDMGPDFDFKATPSIRLDPSAPMASGTAPGVSSPRTRRAERSRAT